MSSSPSPTDLADLTLRVARQAAALAVQLRAQPLDVDTKSSGTDMVTSADRAVEALIIHLIRSERPDDRFVAEESGVTGDADDDAVTWVIDPIDGTTNFLYQHPGWNISIAARHGGRVQAGVVIEPTGGDEFVAARGAGSTRNGQPLRLGPAAALADALIATGFGYDAERRTRQAETVARLIGSVRDIRRMGAAAVDLCSVAAGRVDGYYEFGLSDWDLAAGSLIAEEAGARVASIDGTEPQPPGLVVAAHPDLWEPLAELIRNASR